MAVFAVSVQAQEGWTLRQCIDYAIEHNISIRQSANEAKQSAVSVNTAKWARLPNLNGSAGQSWNWGRTDVRIGDEQKYISVSSHSTNMSLSTNVPIFTGLQIPNQYALAKLNLKAAMADLEKAKEYCFCLFAGTVQSRVTSGFSWPGRVEQRAICPYISSCGIG